MLPPVDGGTRAAVGDVAAWYDGGGGAPLLSEGISCAGLRIVPTML